MGLTDGLDRRIMVLLDITLSKTATAREGGDAEPKFHFCQ
jgi:hypothetical protein